jgi:Resolvase, N terminal domain
MSATHGRARRNGMQASTHRWRNSSRQAAMNCSRSSFLRPTPRGTGKGVAIRKKGRHPRRHEARSPRAFHSGPVKIVEKLEEKQATLCILAMNLDTNSPTGRLLVNLVGSIAQFEREIMLERQREGMAKAKAEGKYKGRAPTARAKSAEVIAMFKVNQKPSEIARLASIGRASVYRILNDGHLVEFRQNHPRRIYVPRQHP